MWEGVDPLLLALKMEEWCHKLKECGQVLENEKHKETDSSLQPLKCSADLPKLGFRPGRSVSDF